MNDNNGKSDNDNDCNNKLITTRMTIMLTVTTRMTRMTTITLSQQHDNTTTTNAREQTQQQHRRLSTSEV